jgi:hypothetical protein
VTSGDNLILHDLDQTEAEVVVRDTSRPCRDTTVNCVAPADLIGVVSSLKSAGRLDDRTFGDLDVSAAKRDMEVYAQLQRDFCTVPPIVRVDSEDEAGREDGMISLDRFFVWPPGGGPFRKSAPPKPSFCVVVVPPDLPPWACLGLRAPRGLVPVLLAVTGPSGPDLAFISLSPVPGKEMDMSLGPVA